MANVNIKLRRYNGAGWDVLYPKTTVDQIVDLSTVGTSLLNQANPAVTSFVQVGTNGSTSYLNASQLKTAIDAANAVHYHTIADINQDATTLQEELDLRADLSNGKILSSQIPDFLFGGLRFIDALTGAQTLSTIYSNINGSTDAEKVGGYFVASGDITVTLGTHTIGYGDDGDETAGGTIVEKGDWLVYAGNQEWAVVNNTYRKATTGARGIVSLSSGTIAVRSGLSSTTDGDKVMDERAVKTVMKEIFYQLSTPSGATGDLWFEGTFA
jgi:hypothetical protein